MSARNGTSNGTNITDYCAQQQGVWFVHLPDPETIKFQGFLGSRIQLPILILWYLLFQCPIKLIQYLHVSGGKIVFT